MELREYWAIIRRRWISILACAIIGLIVAAVFNATATKQYTATAQNFVALTSSSGDENPLTGAQFASQRVKSYTEVVTSPNVLDPVISELGLPYDSAALAGKVTVTNPAQTVLLLVSVVDGSPALAADIANSVSKNLAKQIQELETPTNRRKDAPVKVTLIEPATAPSSPSSPRTTLNLALGLLLGLAVGLGQAFLRHAMDRTLKSSAVLSELSGAPVLGHVSFDKNAEKNHLPALDTRDSTSEGYRTIRANLQYVSVDKPLSSLVVTSAAPGDGKTTISCNLAIALAQAGKKVCLVEADLRKPKVSKYMGVDGSVGLTNVLAGQNELNEVLIPWGRGLVTILGPGSLPPNPSELLGSHQFQNVLDLLKQQFDVVIIDTPPLLAVADATLLGRQVDGVILVTRFGKTTREAVESAATTLAQGGEKVFGAVLNAIPKNHGAYYGEYVYAYEYNADPVGSAAADGTQSPAQAAAPVEATPTVASPESVPQAEEVPDIFKPQSPPQA